MRRAAQTCVERCVRLPGRDRSLVLAVYRDGARVKDLASIVGATGDDDGDRARSSARVLRRRLRVLTGRLLSPKFEFVLAHLEPADQAERRRLGLPTWSPVRRAVAESVVIHGRSLREATRVVGASFHTVRREMSAVNALFEARAGR